MSSPHLIAVETYGSQRVHAPASGAMVSAYKIGYSTVGRAVLLALFGPRALDVTSKHASYHYVSIEGQISAHSGYLLLALTEEEFERVKQITGAHTSRRTGVFWWSQSQWWNFPCAGESQFSPAVNRAGPNVDPTRYRVMSPGSGGRMSSVEGIRAEYSQRSPHEPGWWWITGETYPHRDLLKLKGCRWSKKRSAWYFQGAVLPEAIQALIKASEQQPVKSPAPAESSSSMADSTLLPSAQKTPDKDSEPSSPLAPNAPPLPADDVPPAIRIMAPVLLPADTQALDAVQTAIRHLQQNPITSSAPPRARLMRTQIPIQQACCGELTGSITGQVYCYGFAVHQGVLVYLNLGGPRLAVEAIRAKLSKGEQISLVPPDAPALELGPGETQGKANTGMYTAYLQTLPEARFTSAILVHEWLTQPNYLGHSVTGIFRTTEAQAMAKLLHHIRQLVTIPVFDLWSGYLYQAGQIAGLVRPPFPRGGGIDLLMVDLDAASWTRLITGGLANGVIRLPVQG